MRDIRTDLQERLKALTDELTALSTQAALVQEQRNQIKKMLEIENKRYNSISAAGVEAFGEAISGTVLTIIIKKALADGKSHTLREIVAFAEKQGYDFGQRSAARAINFRLLALKNANHVVRVKKLDGYRGWKLPQKN